MKQTRKETQTEWIRLETIWREQQPRLVSTLPRESQGGLAILVEALREYSEAVDHPTSNIPHVEALELLVATLARGMASTTHRGTLRHAVLELLELRNHPQLLKVLLSILPMLVRDGSIPDVSLPTIWRCVVELVQRKPLMLPSALRCLESLAMGSALPHPLLEHLWSTIRDVDNMAALLRFSIRHAMKIRNTLPETDDDQLGYTIYPNTSTTGTSNNTIWVTFRRFHCTSAIDTLDVAATLLGILDEYPEQVQPFLQTVSDDCQLLDWVVVMSLSQTHSIQTDVILDQWLHNNNNNSNNNKNSSSSIESTNATAADDSRWQVHGKIVFSAFQTQPYWYQKLAEPFIRWISVVVLTQVRRMGREKNSATLTSTTITTLERDAGGLHQFFISLYDSLHGQHQTLLLDVVLQLLEAGWRQNSPEDKILCRQVEVLVGHLIAGVQSPIPEEWKLHLWRYLGSCDCKSVLPEMIPSLLSDATFIKRALPELLSLLQKRLFAAHRSGVQETVQGLRLAKALVASIPVLPSEHCQTIYNWVSLVVQPFTRRSCPPIWGEPFLEFLNTFDIHACSQPSPPVDVFAHLKHILANTGLVQMLAQYQKTQGNNSRKLLGYKTIPSEFDRQKQVRKIVFCVDYYLQRNDVTDSSQWLCVVRWVFKLLDMYLERGRGSSVSEWIPDGWLQSSIEMAPVALHLQTFAPRQESLVRLLNKILNEFELSVYPDKQQQSLRLEEVTQIMYQCTSTGQPMDQFISSLLRLEIAVLLALSLSVAVLKNAFEHFRRKNCLGDSSRTALLRYQMMKIYHLKAKSYLIKDVLLGFQSAVNRSSSRKNKRSGKLKSRGSASRTPNTEMSRKYDRLKEKIIAAISDIDIVHEILLSNSNGIAPDVLWHCLEYRYEDDLLQPLDQKAMSSSLPDHLDPELVGHWEFKYQVLLHLSAILGNSVFAIPIPRSSLAYCLRSTSLSHLSLVWLRKLSEKRSDTRENNEAISLHLRLSEAYLRLFFLLLSNAIKPVESVQRDVDPGFVGWGLPAFASFCESCDVVLQVSQAVVDDERTSNNLARKLFLFFRSQLEGIEYASVISWLLDVLSFIAMEVNESLLDDLIELNWKTLIMPVVYSTYTHDESLDKSASYAQTKALERLKHKSQADTVLARMLDGTVVKLTQRSSFSRKFGMERRSLLRHWGMLLFKTRLISKFSSHFVDLTEELGHFLSSVNSTSRTSRKRQRSGAVIDQLSKDRSPIPCLDMMTFPDYFETMLLITLGTVAAVEPADESMKRATFTNSGPYHHLIKLFRIFRRLMDLYRASYQLFPNKTTIVVFRTARDMIGVTIAQLQRCAAWRNSQPLLPITERKAGAYDAGALLYFEKLLESIAIHVIGTALALSNVPTEMSSAGIEFPLKRMTLRACADKAEREVKEVASVHNLPIPFILSGSSTTSVALMERSRTPFVLCDKREEHDSDSNDSYQAHDSTTGEEKNEEDLSESDSGSLDGDDEEGLFAIDGNWGFSQQGSDSGDSLKLQSNAVVKSS